MKLNQSIMDTPVLLIAWRRPQTLRLVIEAIRPVEPSLLFIACDGPSPSRLGEVEKVEATRQVIKQEINWPCKIHRLYSDANQGCRQGVSRAISWFFDHVEEGIILEDDCIPDPSFFPYCVELLKRYRDDTRVWCVSGNNFQNGQWRGEGSYYFSRIPLIWGWATWRRCWQHYDVGISQWPIFRDSGLMETAFIDPVERIYWQNIWQWLFYNHKPDTWDYQWCFTCISHGGLSIEPNRNLVVNIGFGDDATHTTDAPPIHAEINALESIEHPQFVLCNQAASIFTFDHKFGGLRMRRDFEIMPRLRARMWRYFKYLRLNSHHSL